MAPRTCPSGGGRLTAGLYRVIGAPQVGVRTEFPLLFSSTPRSRNGWIPLCDWMEDDAIPPGAESARGSRATPGTTVPGCRALSSVLRVKNNPPPLRGDRAAGGPEQPPNAPVPRRRARLSGVVRLETTGRRDGGSRATLEASGSYVAQSAKSLTPRAAIAARGARRPSGRRPCQSRRRRLGQRPRSSQGCRP